MRLTALNPYMVWIKWGAVLVAFVLAYRWAYGQGYDAAELQRMKAEQATYEAAVDRAATADQKLRDAMSRAPKSNIREVVRENHSDCVRPPAVDKRLRDALREGNEAISR